MPPRWRWIALAALIAATSCSGSDDARPSARDAAVRFEGRILAIGFSGGDNVQIYDLATNRAAPLSLPSGVEVLGAFWGPDGTTAYALATSVGSLGTPTATRRVQLYEVAPGEDAQPVGRSLSDTEALSLAVAGSKVLVEDCRPGHPRLVLMDVEGERRWEPVAPSCTGTLTPDGETIVYADGTRLFERPIDGGPAEAVADVGTVTDGGEPVATEGVAGLRDSGDALVALVVVADRIHPAIGGHNERFRFVRMQDYPSSVGAAPQPGGDLIALTQLFGNSRTTALIRMFDTATGRSEVVGAGGGGYFEPAWAPDGETMVTSSGAGNWVFIDTSGDWIDVRKVTGLVAQDWAP